MTSTERIGILNEARRSNIAQKHPVSPARQHAVDITTILLGAVAEGKS